MRTRPIPTLVPVKSAPICIRLPKTNGEECPWTGLSRSQLKALVIPSEDNGYKPPVKSIVYTDHRGNVRLRLIHFQSLVDYIDGQAQQAKI